MRITIAGCCEKADIRWLSQIAFEGALRDAYTRLGYRVIQVPLFCSDREGSIQRRLEFIEACLREL